MMESSKRNKADCCKQVEPEDLKRGLSAEFSALSHSQHSVTDEREHLKVYLRIRPFTSAEKENGDSQDCVAILPPDKVLMKPPSFLSGRLSNDRSLPQTVQRFEFSQVYGPETSQKELFDGTVKDLVRDVLEGGDSLLFTYGVTNAGKTFTFVGPEADPGVLPQSLSMIFSNINERIFTSMSIKPYQCQEFMKLSREQQAEEEVYKRKLLGQHKESEKCNISQLTSTNKIIMEGSFIVGPTPASENRLSLDVETHTKFSVWVSFCEIYNENIHDLLEALPSGGLRRTALRLSQDVKGNAFIKDLRWVQVNSAVEAYKVMKLGKKNQSFSSTRLNQLSSRSHSIFSIRILRIEDDSTPRVHSVSELCLCDLAGSERCAKTQNNGERLKEAGNINTSLLILGKCINALRYNQQAKLLQHVPFRESKLTHYLQGFFSGRGKACMIVNINQCASMYDETLNVLKFSAVAQKVIVLSTKTLAVTPQGCTTLLSNTNGGAPSEGARSSPIGWESSLEDLQEEEGSLLEDTVEQSSDEENYEIVIKKRTYQDQMARLRALEEKLKKEQVESLLIEARVREEVSIEFQKLFSDMQTDFIERLEREREIMQERADNRLEIFKKLVEKVAVAGPSEEVKAMVTHFLSSASHDLMDIKKVAEAALRDLGSAHPVVKGGRADPLDFLEDLCRKLLEVKEMQQNQNLSEDSGHKASDKVVMYGSCEEEAPNALTEARRLQVTHQTSRAEQVIVEQGAAQEQLNQCCRTILDKTSQIHILTKEVQSLKQELQIAAASSETLNLLKEEVCDLKKIQADETERCESKQREILQLEKELAQTKEEFVHRQEMSNQQLQQITQQLKHQEALWKQEVEELSKKVQEQEAIPQKQLAELETKLKCKEEELQHLRRQLEEQTLTSEKLTEQLKHQEALWKQEVVELSKKVQEQEAVPQKQLAELETKLKCKEEELQHLRRQLEEQTLTSEKLTEHLKHQEALSKQEVEELNKKVQEQEAIPQKQLAELETKLKCKEEEIQHLRRQLEEQTLTSVKQIKELNEKLREQELTSQQHLKELSEHKTASEQLLEDLRQQLTEQKQTSGLPKVEPEEAILQVETDSAVDILRRKNADLHTEVSSLKERLDSMAAKNINPTAPRFEDLSSSLLSSRMAEMEQMLKETENKLAEREAILQKELSEKEAQVTSLQKCLKEAQEKRDVEEIQAVQKTRQREVEHRRELLAVAHEAIAQKDAELEKRVEEIRRLKESTEQDSEKVKNLSLELQRKDDDMSDLREKLADYKKQIQQVEKKISATRDEEKTLRQKLCDLEKTKKQLQADVTNRDRTIQQLKMEQQSDAKTEQKLQLHQQACKEGEAKDRVIADMRAALMEQEVTQQQMDEVLEEKQSLIQELTNEVEKLRGMLTHQERDEDLLRHTAVESNDVRLTQAQENLKLCKDKYEAERLLWVKEKLSLLGQVKEAEDKRNKEMTTYAKDRKCNAELQSQMKSLLSQLTEKEQVMEKWRTERDTLVAALEVRIKNLWSNLAEKDKLIQELNQNSTQPPQEVNCVSVAELQAALSDRDNEIQRLKELQASTPECREAATQTQSIVRPAAEGHKDPKESRISGGKRCTRASVSSHGSSRCPSVLDASEISTENGRTSRFPQPEMEISFSPLQPNRMALRRQGEDSSVTVKLNRPSRKRKSAELMKTYIFRRRKGQTAQEEDVEAENRRNIRLVRKQTPHQDESSPSASSHDSVGQTCSRKEGTLQKIGGFLQSSPTLLSSKAKKMMNLVSSRSEESSGSSSSLSLRLRSKKKPYRPDISSPMEVPPHLIINRDLEQNDSDHETSKKRRRIKIPK
ncbi:kinesin-like protein KIF20B [Thalassophryne amazonica]|uniref:kinesin-like protein KIF20B n=1 Tax=Thalassophryne amazonica TaxID=390379 RepID=UPI001471A638|nr:kinesin-like protein KIF20B [Thalassophryne amazonica]